MGLKSLSELNQEFQMEIEKKHIEPKSEYTETHSIIKPLEIKVEPPKKGLKSLSELNQEFQMEIEKTERRREEFGFISPLVIEAGPPIFAKAAKTETNFTENSRDFPDVNIFTEYQSQNKKSKNKKHNTFAIVSDMLFYIAILTVLFAVLTSGSQDGAPRMLMGYSYFTVLTPSMQDEIPRGSFILVHKTDPQNLNIGDNITFMRDANTTVTHKIIDIYENYENSGARGFETKGVNNTNPDNDIVYEANIVGKVVFVLPGAGAAIVHIRENIYIVVIIFGLCIILSFLLRALFAKPVRFVREDKPKQI